MSIWKAPCGVCIYGLCTGGHNNCSDFRTWLNRIIQCGEIVSSLSLSPTVSWSCSDDTAKSPVDSSWLHTKLHVFYRDSGLKIIQINMHLNGIKVTMIETLFSLETCMSLTTHSITIWTMLFSFVHLFFACDLIRDQMLRMRNFVLQSRSENLKRIIIIQPW